MGVRKALFAGSWYPDTSGECEREIKRFLGGMDAPPQPGKKRVGGIVPHAGWYFSGAIACRVIASLKDAMPPDVFVLFGMHLHPGSSRYIMTEGAWETPFGPVAVHAALAAEVTRRFAFKLETAERFTQDNTVELQLPFIKYLYPQTAILPVGAPPETASIDLGKAVAEEAVRLGLRVRVIGSTDLTHYGYNYGFVSQGTGPSAVRWVRDENDRRIIERMLAMEPEQVIAEGLASQNACCSGAAAAAIAAGKALGAVRAEELHYATSYDKNPGDSFVGYVGIVF
jgi:AmmeMemoRadiSam system protein B